MKFLCACLLAFALVGTAHAASSEQVRALMEKSGIDTQLAAIPDVVAEGFRQAASQDAARRRDEAGQLRVEEAMREVFAFEPMHAEVARHIAAGLRVEDVTAILRWLESPLGAQFTALENEMANPEFHAQMQAHAQALGQLPPPAPRVELLRAFDAATGSSGVMAQIMLNTQLALTLGMTSGLPDAERSSLVQILEQLEAHRPAVERMAQGQTLVQFLYAYRDVSDADLQRYLDFARSEPGQRYWRVGGEALTQALFASAE